MDWIENKIASLVFCKTRRNLIFLVGWIAWIARNSTFFGFTEGKEDKHRGRFDTAGLREGDEEGVLFGVEDTLWRRSDFSVFFNTIRYKKWKENLLK